MNVIFFGLAAIILYVVVAARTSEIARSPANGFKLWSATGALSLLAVAAHAAALYPTTITPTGVNLGIFNVASVVAWVIALVCILAASRQPTPSLSVVVLPFSAAIVGISLIFSNERLVSPANPGIAIHITLSLLAYSLFAIAALQALYLAFAEHRLKRHTPVLGFLPPLPEMERIMFQLTGIAFLLLSAGLLVGGHYIENVYEQHLSHKIFFSIVAWLVFATLLLGRLYWHWHGHRACKYVLAGFLLLALGFFGSKIALELILQRV